MKSKTDIRTLSEKELNARLVRDLTEACPVFNFKKISEKLKLKL